MILRGVVAWTQLFGMINFELFGQFKGTFDPADDFFAHAVELMADVAGLPERRSLSLAGSRRADRDETLG